MNYGQDGQGSIAGRGNIFFFTPQRPDQLWSQPSLLYIDYGNLKAAWRESDHSSPSTSEKLCGAIPPYPSCRDHYLSTGRAFIFMLSPLRTIVSRSRYFKSY
jgi:hypothetical protein